MAHIVLNALSLRPGGGLQVARALLAGQLEAKAGHRFTVLWSDPASHAALAQVFGGHPDVTLINPVGNSNNMALFAWQMLRLKAKLRALNADLMLSLNHHFPSGQVPQVVYHVNVLRFERPSNALWAGGELADRLRDWRASLALHRASANVMESQFLLDLAQNRACEINAARVIYIGQASGKPLQQSSHAKTGPQRLLALTSAQPHKDNPTLVRTLVALTKTRAEVDWQLEIAGGKGVESFADLVALAEELGVSERLTFLGFQSHEDLAKRAQAALCCISTSQVESFAMTALEAMSWSCPPLVSNASSMPESVGDAGLLAGAGDAGDFASCALEIFDDASARKALIKRGHTRIAALTWVAAAHEFGDVFEQCLGGDTPLSGV